MQPRQDNIDDPIVYAFLRQCLISALEKNNTEQLKNLLSDYSIPLNTPRGKDMYLIHMAARWYSAECVALLLDAGAKIDVLSTSKRTALHYAAQRDDTSVLSLLLERGAKLDSQDFEESPLWDAVRSGSLDCVRMLLAAGANFTTLSATGESLLCAAAYRGAAMLDCLLEFNADKYDSENLTLRLLAKICCSKGSEKHIQRLLNKLSNSFLISCLEESTNNPLYAAVISNNHVAVKVLLQDERVKRVVNNEYSFRFPNTGRSSRTRLLNYACELGFESVATALHEAGAAIQQSHSDANGRDSLESAVRAQNYSKVACLLKYGYPVNQVLKNGSTLLHLAVDKGDADIAALLLQHGANIKAENLRGETAFLNAMEHGREHLLDVLLAYGADPLKTNFKFPSGYTVKSMQVPCINIAACRGLQRTVERLLQEQVVKDSFNQRTDPFGNALHAAVTGGHDKIIKVLLEAGAIIDSGDEAWMVSHYVKLHKSSQEGFELLLNQHIKQFGNINTLLEDMSDSLFEFLIRALEKPEYNQYNLIDVNAPTFNITNLTTLKSQIYYRIKNTESRHQKHKLCQLALDKDTAIGKLVHLQRGKKPCGKDNYNSTAWWIDRWIYQPALKTPHGEADDRTARCEIGQALHAYNQKQLEKVAVTGDESLENIENDMEPASVSPAPVSEPSKLYPELPQPDLQVEQDIDAYVANVAEELPAQKPFNPFDSVDATVATNSAVYDPFPELLIAAAFDELIEARQVNGSALLDQIDGEDIFAAKRCANPFDGLTEKTAAVTKTQSTLFAVPADFNVEQGQKDLMTFFEDDQAAVSHQPGADVEKPQPEPASAGRKVRQATPA